MLLLDLATCIYGNAHSFTLTPPFAFVSAAHVICLSRPLVPCPMSPPSPHYKTIKGLVSNFVSRVPNAWPPQKSANSKPLHMIFLLLFGCMRCHRLKKHPWMKARFQKMGGKYNQWYTSKVTERRALSFLLFLTWLLHALKTNGSFKGWALPEVHD